MPNFGLKDFSLPWKGRIPSSGSGTNGVNAFTVLTADFVQPAVGASVVASVANSSWAALGQVVFVAGGGGYYSVSAKPTATSITLTNLDYSGNATAGASVPAPSQVSPSGPIGGASPLHFGTNYQTLMSGNTYGMGPGGFSGDSGTTSGFLIAATTSIASLRLALSPATTGLQELTCRLRKSTDDGATYNIIGTPLVLGAGVTNGLVTFPPETLNVGDLLIVTMSINSGSLTTFMSATAA